LKVVFIALNCRHALSWVIELFRRWEIEKYGKVDVYGVPGGKYEGILGSIQYFLIIFLIGFVSKELSGID
jgi:hypothetical protein